MIFCEQCRITKNWPLSPGYPYIGIRENSKCDICHVSQDCHDIPGSILEPPTTAEGKLALKIMQQGYRDKAEQLVVCNMSGAEAGKINHRETSELRKVLVEVRGDIDWYTTYHLRVAAIRGYEQKQNLIRDRRKYVI